MSNQRNSALFPSTIPEAEWCEFPAAGFSHAVSGVVYRGGNAAKGVPLGGLGTGYLELTASGMLGNTTIFNHFPKPRTLDQPFLAIAHGEEVRLLTRRPNAEASEARDSAYWGHYPVADMQYDLDLPFGVSVRAWTPFIPGDAEASNTPGASFEVRLENLGASPAELRVACAFPGPEAQANERFERSSIDGDDAPGVTVTSTRFGRRVGYALAVLGADGMESGALLGGKELPWIAAAGHLPPAQVADPGTTIVGHLTIPPGEARTLRFILAWYYPDYRLGFSYHHMYARRFGGVDEVARYLVRNYDGLLRRTLAWQEVIYSADLPGWLKDALINGLYSLAKNTWWNYSDLPDDWWGEEGLFTHSESFTGCPITETMVCRFHGHFATLFFFPQLERTTLRAFAHYQLKSGEIPFSFGHPAGLYDPRFTCQHPLNSSQFVQLVYRYYCRTADEAFLREIYPTVRDAMNYLKTLDVDVDGLVNDQPHALPGEIWPANQFYDIWPWHGTSAYVAGTWLATLRCAMTMAQKVGDVSGERDDQLWFERGHQSFEAKLWNGRYYRVYNDPANDQVSEVSLANQLMGEWCTRVVGLGGLFATERVASALEAVADLNVKAGAAVIVNGVNPDGAPYRSRADAQENDHAAGCFVGENSCAAMTMLYSGKAGLGLEVARRIYEAIFLRHRTPWDQYCIIAPSDGHPIWGNDYYSNLIVWALPMAVLGQDIAGFTAPGGLADTILQAGKAVAEAES